MGVWACVHYGVPNKGRLGSGVPHREPSVLHVIVEAVAGDLGASQASSQLPGGEGGADEGKSSCLTSRIGVCRGERETARDLNPEAGSVQPGETIIRGGGGGPTLLTPPQGWGVPPFGRNSLQTMSGWRL